MKLAKNLLPHKQAHFLIVGDGDEFNLINKLKKDWYLKNVTLFVVDTAASVEGAQDNFVRVHTTICQTCVLP